MGIRFSMKWLLAGVVYVAVAATAFTQAERGWGDALWVISHLAICYAAGLAIYGAGVRSARGLGFLMGSLALVITLEVSPDRVPVVRIIAAISPPVVEMQGPRSPQVRYVTIVSPAACVRAGNAVAAMLAGAAGSLMTTLAYRNCQSPLREH
jgi:hypothetical protein